MSGLERMWAGWKTKFLNTENEEPAKTYDGSSSTVIEGSGPISRTISVSCGYVSGGTSKACISITASDPFDEDIYFFLRSSERVTGYGSANANTYPYSEESFLNRPTRMIGLQGRVAVLLKGSTNFYYEETLSGVYFGSLIKVFDIDILNIEVLERKYVITLNKTVNSNAIATVSSTNNVIMYHTNSTTYPGLYLDTSTMKVYGKFLAACYEPPTRNEYCTMVFVLPDGNGGKIYRYRAAPSGAGTLLSGSYTHPTTGRSFRRIYGIETGSSGLSLEDPVPLHIGFRDPDVPINCWYFTGNKNDLSQTVMHMSERRYYPILTYNPYL